jgi:hypothetical protein
MISRPFTHAWTWSWPMPQPPGPIRRPLAQAEPQAEREDADACQDEADDGGHEARITVRADGVLSTGGPRRRCDGLLLVFHVHAA